VLYRFHDVDFAVQKFVRQPTSRDDLYSAGVVGGTLDSLYDSTEATIAETVAE
jgi:hypothetical protein